MVDTNKKMTALFMIAVLNSGKLNAAFVKLKLEK